MVEHVSLRTCTGDRRRATGEGTAATQGAGGIAARAQTGTGLSGGAGGTTAEAGVLKGTGKLIDLQSTTFLITIFDLCVLHVLACMMPLRRTRTLMILLGPVLSIRVATMMQCYPCGQETKEKYRK